jgi:hypothetical protein
MPSSLTPFGCAVWLQFVSSIKQESKYNAKDAVFSYLNKFQLFILIFKKNAEFAAILFEENGTPNCGKWRKNTKSVPVLTFIDL